MKTRNSSEDRAWMQSRKRLMPQLATSLLYLGAAVASAQTFTVLHNFYGSDGALPNADLALSGSTLYGMTCGATIKGRSVGQTVFRIHTDGSGYDVLHTFPGVAGVEPVPAGGLVVHSNTVYGTKFHTDGSQWGMVFKVTTDGSTFAVIKDFNGGDGAGPCAPLVASNSTLYGTTTGGGYQSDGTVFKINIDGSDHTILKDFGRVLGADGRSPRGGLILSGTTLYGTASSGGISNCGTVFKIVTDGSNFTVLHQFHGSDGAKPYAGLVLSGTTLYGTTREGGIAYRGPPYVSYGTVFKVHTDGSGYTVLKDFSGGSDGAWPQAGLVLVGSTLFGTTLSSGLHFDSDGRVFKINTDGSGFSVLPGLHLQKPCGRMVSSDTLLYGTEFELSIYGRVFRLSVAPPTIATPPSSQTAEVGTMVHFAGKVAGDPALMYQWRFNGTNLNSCGTNSSLVLTNVQPSNGGTYTVVVTNVFGAVTSSPAMLNVIPPVERRPVPGFNLTGEAGSSLNVEHTEAVAPAPTWLPLNTVTLVNPQQFDFDLSAPLPPQRFYRAWQSGTPTVSPALEIQIIPMLTLTGNVGSKLQVDGINQFGPTDAWFTLGTVTLTNTAQLYFDVSVIGQPARLYRLVPVP